MATILIVDDEESIRWAVRRVLERAGHHVVDAPDGSVAANLLSAFAEDYFNLVLSDIDMPRMDGIELAHTVRRLRPNLPIMLMTGGSSWRTGPAVPHGVEVFDKIDLATRLVAVVSVILTLPSTPKASPDAS